jgi:hypothetical protein
MANYPPAPPAGGYPPAPPGGAYVPASAYDPAAAEKAFNDWVQARGFTLNASADVRWYQSWFPCVYAYPIHRIGRELRATSGSDQLWMVEAWEDDAIKRAAGEDRHVYLFITSEHFKARSAIRSKGSGGGVIDDIGHGIGSLFSSNPTGVLADPTFEAKYDVTVPSKQEGETALPAALRVALVQSNWRGILEVRAGGLVAVPFGVVQFDPEKLDQLVALGNQALQA